MGNKFYLGIEGDPHSMPVTATAVVAAKNASLRTKMLADFELDGTDDDVIILRAINSLPDHSAGATGTKTGKVIILGHDITLSSQLDLPPVQDFVLDARDCAIGGAGIRLDSAMDAWLYFGVLTGGAGLIGLDIDPRTTGPDSLKIFTDSRVYISSIAGESSPYTADSVGLRLRANTGIISNNIFELINVHGFQRLIYAPNPGTSMWFQDNIVIAKHLYEGTTGYRDGDSGAAGNRRNRASLGFTNNVDSYGAEIYGDRSLYEIITAAGAPTNEVVHFQSGATGNIVICTSDMTGQGWTDESANESNRVITPIIGQITHHTANATLYQADHGSIHTNRGATGTITFSLPALVGQGCSIEFVVMAAYELRIDPGSAGGIYINGAKQADNMYISADDEGESVKLVSDGGGDWVAMHTTGTWSVET